MATLAPSSAYFQDTFKTYRHQSGQKTNGHREAGTMRGRKGILYEQSKGILRGDLPHTAIRWGFTMHRCTVTLPLLLKTAVSREREIRVRA